MENKKKNRISGPVLILLAGAFWGSMGLFVRRLNAWGFTSRHVACLRLSVGALVFLLLLLLSDRKALRIRLRDLPLFLGLGILSVLFFTFCYFRAIELMPLSTAAILLYTSPIWVTLMTVLFFREKLSPRRLLALGLAFSGCVLVSGLSGEPLSPAALLTGLGAGLGYALYSILGTVALRRYPPLAVTTWTFLIAAAGSWFLCGPASLLATVRAAPAGELLWLIPCTAVVTAVIPYLAYTGGLQSTEAGRAAIIATVEPVVATLLGTLVFQETLSLPAALGILLVLAAIALLNTGKRQPAETPGSDNPED